MLSAIGHHFPREIRYTRPEGGMFLWASLPQNISATRLFEKAIKEQVAFVPGHPFYLGKEDSPCLRLNFTNADEKTISKGIEVLGGVMKEELKETR